jgi:predicted enzyme related to lactoylglutathione lyase
MNKTRKELNMNQGFQTVIYPVKDIARAKKLFNGLLGVEPVMDEAYYVGYKLDGQDIGLDPNGYSQGMTGPVVYYHVSDIKQSLQALLDAGANVMQEVKDVGGGKLIATAKGPEGNIIGLIQSP